MFVQSQLNNAQNTEQATATLGQLTVAQLKQAWLGGDGNWSDATHWSDTQYTRTNQMVTQYNWLYERASVLSWKPKG